VRRHPNASRTHGGRRLTGALRGLPTVDGDVVVGSEGSARTMLDLLMLAITVAFFALAFASIRWLDRI
jgi:hypothetical protein